MKSSNHHQSKRTLTSGLSNFHNECYETINPSIGKCNVHDTTPLNLIINSSFPYNYSHHQQAHIQMDSGHWQVVCPSQCGLPTAEPTTHLGASMADATLLNLIINFAYLYI